MDWDKIPPGTIAVKMPANQTFEETRVFVKKLMQLSQDHNMGCIICTSYGSEPSMSIEKGTMSKFGVPDLPPSKVAPTKFVTFDAWCDFLDRYDKNPNKSWYRFGQAFYNEMVGPVLRKDGAAHSHPELFYCTDRVKATDMILDTYVIIT